MRTRTLLLFATLIASTPALADDPKPWPGAAKEKLAGLAMGAPAAAVEKALGKATHKDPVEEEAATGEWVSQWTFKGGESAVLTAGKKTGPLALRMLDVKAPSKAKTAEKIGIGSSVADLKKAYGSYLTINEATYAVGDSLAFIVAKDQVTEILFGQIGGE